MQRSAGVGDRRIAAIQARGEMSLEPQVCRFMQVSRLFVEVFVVVGTEEPRCAGPGHLATWPPGRW